MKQLSRNLLVTVFGEFGSRFLGFITAAYLARVLEPMLFGMISIGSAVYGYALMTTQAGTGILGTRSVAQGSDGEFMSHLLGLRLFFALLGLIVAVVLGMVLGLSTTQAGLIMLYMLSLFPSAMLLDWFFQGKEKMEVIGWSRIIVNGVYLVCVLLFVTDPERVWVVPVAFFAGNSAGMMLMLFVYKASSGSLKVHWRPLSLFQPDGQWRVILNQSFPLSAGSIVSQLSLHGSPIILGVISTVVAAGYFSAASRLVAFFMVFDRLVGMFLLPAIVRHYKSSPHDLSTMLSLALRFIALVVSPVSVGIVVLSDDVVSLVFGASFVNAVGVVQILMWYFLLSSLSTVFVFGLIGIGQEQHYSKTMAIGVAVQLIAIFCGALMGDAIGAAVGYVVGEAFILILFVITFQRFIEVAFWKSVLRPLLAAGTMGILLFAVRSFGLSVSIPTGALFFVLTTLVLGGLRKRDIVVLKTKLL